MREVEGFAPNPYKNWRGGGCIPKPQVEQHHEKRHGSSYNIWSPSVGWIRKTEWQGPVLVLPGHFVHHFQTPWGHLHTSVPQAQLHVLGEENGLRGGEPDLVVQENTLRDTCIRRPEGLLRQWEEPDFSCTLGVTLCKCHWGKQEQKQMWSIATNRMWK